MVRLKRPSVVWELHEMLRCAIEIFCTLSLRLKTYTFWNSAENVSQMISQNGFLRRFKIFWSTVSRVIRLKCLALLTCLSEG